jgi:hypothetical protein
MKFCHSTNIKLVIALLGWLIGCAGFAQSTHNSAYSRFGLGLIEPPGTFTHFGMGGVTTPMADQFVLNFANPASYSFLELTTLQVAAKGGLSTFSTNNESAKIQYGQINEMGFGFKKPGSKWGIAVGVAPYSSVDYTFRAEQQLNDSVKAQYLYNGSGGLNKATIGISRLFRINDTRVIKDSTKNIKGDTSIKIVHQLSIGVNGNYLFGNLTRSNNSYITNSNYFLVSQKVNLWTQGWFAEAGLLYKVNLTTKIDEQKRISGGSILQIGANYALNSCLSTSYDQIFTSDAYSSQSNSFLPVDTSYFVKGERGKLKIPQKISLGIALKLYEKKLGTITLAGDYKIQDWSKYELATVSDANLDAGLRTSSTISLGIEYKPAVELNTDLLHRVQYRAGIRSTETHLILKDTPITQKGISAGLTIPIIKSTSKFHIGAEYGTFGTTENDLVKETYLQFMIGFTLTPSSFDRWFRQVKYD